MDKLRLIFISAFSLFLLACSPIANLSSRIKDVSPVVTREDLAPEPGNLADTPHITDLKSKDTDITPTNFVANPVSPLPTSSTPTYDHINISGHIIPTFNVYPINNQLPNSGSRVGIYNDIFLYGHNTPNVFGDLHMLSVGDTFSVTKNGITTNYRIQIKNIIARKDLDQSTQASRATLWSIYHATYHGNFDLSIMTCAGTSYGNGDASHRLIIMASKI